MSAQARPIRHTLMTVILLACGAVMLITTAAFIAYEYVTFRQLMVRNVKILGEAIAANSTAALAFDNPDDAREVLAAFKAQPHVVAARLYQRDGQLIASYPDRDPRASKVQPLRADGYRFERGLLSGVQPVVQGSRRMGTLYLESDLGEIYEHFQLFMTIGAVIFLVCCIAAYLISRPLQELISRPILALATTAQRVSEHRDYSVRATRPHGYEFGILTDAFNHMLTRIEGDQTKLRSQLSRLDLLHRITRATGERHDLQSVFRVVLHHLGDVLPLDFACMCVYDASAAALSIAVIDSRSAALAVSLGLAEAGRVPIDQNGLARCVAGELVHEPDTREIQFPFPQRFAQAGVRALVVAPLLVESQVFGVLVAARREPDSFSSTDCEFLRQLSEHVALAAHQAQLYGELQRAYDDLRQSQQAILQQERLRALGEMASGIAHDINNAISPAALYTESLLEREPGLSERAQLSDHHSDCHRGRRRDRLAHARVLSAARDRDGALSGGVQSRARAGHQPHASALERSAPAARRGHSIAHRARRGAAADHGLGSGAARRPHQSHFQCRRCHARWRHSHPAHPSPHQRQSRR
ncbi:MAG: GAF domain-containing protein [Gammaproteobacteria bacterium]|nr:MAG: GAF domain-containing protein [Gammaproteobacteria bacterium]